MHELTAFHWVEAIGWTASFLTVATYAMNTMMPLRVLAIASSVCFIFYATVLQLWPLLAMELLLLPINLYRFWQILSLRGKVSQTTAGTPADFSLIKTYGRARRIKAGTLIFQRGDPVDQLYYLTEGRVLIDDFDVQHPPAISSARSRFSQTAPPAPRPLGVWRTPWSMNWTKKGSCASSLKIRASV